MSASSKLNLTMALFEWNAPISAVHGKLWKGMGAAKRKSANNKGEQPNYSVNYGKRTTAATAAELAARTRFATLVAMYNFRKADTTKRILDQTNFRLQSTYKTLKAYVFAQCIAELDGGGGE